MATKSSNLLFESLETLHSQRAECYLVDLRRHPRFDAYFSGGAATESGELVDVMITNISRSGLQLEGGQKMVDAFFANLEHRHTPTSLQVSFSLPGDTAVKIQCTTAYARCDEKHICQIGVEFVTFDKGGDAFTEYVSALEHTVV